MKSFEEMNHFYKTELQQAVNADAALATLVGPIQFVFGFGPEYADVVLIGEAPGKDESGSDGLLSEKQCHSR